MTRVLVDRSGTIAGFFTLATGQIDFADLPTEVARGLPNRVLPVAVLAWLGVDRRAKAFYRRWSFREMPGRPMSLFLTIEQLEALMTPEADPR